MLSARPILALLGLLVWGLAQPAVAEERKILVATPKLGPGVPRELASRIASAVEAGLARVSARTVAAAEVQQGMRGAGVSSLRSRADSIKVAEAVMASALMRYAAKMQSGGQLQLQLAIYLTGTGKAVMLEKSMDPAQLGPTVDTMVAELLPPAPSQPPPPPPPLPPDQSHAITPASRPATPGLTLWASAPLHAQRGLALTLFLGGTAPLGGNSELLTTGLRVGIHAGFQLRLGQRHALIPELTLGYTDWGFSDDPAVAGATGGVSIFNLFVGLRYSAYVGPIDIFVALRGGLGHFDLEAKDYYGRYDDSLTHAGLGGDLGAHYMFLRQVGAGLFLDLTKTFNNAKDDRLLYDFSGLGFSGGISVRGKIPF